MKTATEAALEVEEQKRAKYRKQTMVHGIVYMIAANSALADEDIEQIISELQNLLFVRKNVPF